MADSALETAKIVTSSYRAKAKEKDVALNQSSNIKTPSSLRLIPKRIKDCVVTSSVSLLANQAASTTKTTTDSDKKKKSKVAVEVRSSSRVACETIALESHNATELSDNGQFDHGQRRHIKTVALDEKKRRRSDRYDSSESSDSGVASLACSDASSWSSSSDITEPVSPASPASSQPSPLGQAALDSSSTSHHFVAINSVRVVEPCIDSKQICNDTRDKSSLKGNPTSALVFPSPLSSTQKRRRRFSDSTATELLRHLKSGVVCVRERSKRVRRLSGESVANDIPFETDQHYGEMPVGVNGPSFPANMKQCWQNNTSIEKNQNPDKFIETNLRQSWPLSKRIQQKSGQLKITEFFSTQVKQHWNYSRFSDVENKEDKFSVGLNSFNWRLPVSRVAIVSVAQVDHHNDDVTLNPHTFTASVGFEKKRPASATRPLDCAFPAKTGPAPIRFPIDQATAYHKSDVPLPASVTVLQCMWRHCTSRLTSGQSLLEHIQTAHVASQASTPSTQNSWSGSSAIAEIPVDHANCDELYSCQWEGCKVQGRTSSSRAWLERHVLLHGGHKPFRCIVDLCEHRFNSQAALERHVNAHFNQESGQSNGLRRDNAPAKVVRRNSKKHKHRRSKASPARLFDYFDSGVMERLRHQLSQASHDRLGFSLLNNDLTVHSQVIGRRLEANGKSSVLLQWLPADVLPNEWVSEDKVVTHKNVSLRNVSNDIQLNLLIPPTSSNTTKQRRKR